MSLFRPIAITLLVVFAACLIPFLARAETPTESLPPVTVRWEDAAQTEVFVIEGAHYRCRVATRPARILSLEADGVNVLGPEGARVGIADGVGKTFTPAPASFTPHWNVWRRKWVPATGSRARMNVWSAGLYYEDAHLLDIPLISDASQAAIAGAGVVVQSWPFDDTAQGWTARNDCTVVWRNGALAIETSGPDPNIQSGPLNLSGPFDAVIRTRTEEAGVGQLYWMADDDTAYTEKNSATFPVMADGAWHDYRVHLTNVRHLKSLRFDPPGDTGVTELKTIQLLSQPGETAYRDAPIRGHLVFHAFPDQLRIELRADVKADPADMAAQQPARAFLKMDLPLPTDVVAKREQGQPILSIKADKESLVILGQKGASIDAKAGTWNAPLSAAQPSACWIIRPVAAGDNILQLFKNDLTPLDASAVSVTGGKWLGYDPIAGLYKMQADVNLAAFGFEQAFMNPNREAVIKIGIRDAEKLPRDLVVKCATGIGNLEAAVLTDPYGFPLPTAVQVSKNFNGEFEEPDDAAFGDSYFPLELAPGEKRSFCVVPLIQNWGDHPLKQVSSIRFNNIYWHLSTGASESTCFTQNWMEIGRSGALTIPDFRPRSGAMYVEQPQHDCEQWPGFLQYNNGAARLVYETTSFQSVGPNLARFTMHYHTSDGAATAKLTVMEIPQRDEMRTFVHLHYDWQKSATVLGDARMNFRWLNLFEKRKPDALYWTDVNGATRSQPVMGADKPMFVGEPLCMQSPFIGSQATLTPVTANAADEIGKNYHCLVLVRTFHARLAGREYRQPAFSAAFGAQDGSYWLTAPIDSLVLQPGDYVDADVMLMPFSGPTTPEFEAERERTQRFGAKIPRLTDVTVGTKRHDFPADVQASDDVAACTLTGGYDEMPLIVEGFKKSGIPLLWRDGVYQDQQVNGGDGYEIEGDGLSAGGSRITLLYPIREGQRIPLLVTRADCTSGISRIREVNGVLTIESPTTAAAGIFTLKAPVLFAPGQNVAVSGTPTYSFTGRGVTSVHQVPIRVAVANGQAVVAINDSATSVTTTGAPCTVTFTNLIADGAYVVTINGATTRQKALADGTISFSATANICHIECIESRQDIPRR